MRDAHARAPSLSIHRHSGATRARLGRPKLRGERPHARVGSVARERGLRREGRAPMRICSELAARPGHRGEGRLHTCARTPDDVRTRVLRRAQKIPGKRAKLRGQKRNAAIANGNAQRRGDRARHLVLYLKRVLCIDSDPFKDLVPSLSLRENERGSEIGGNWDPTHHQPTDVLTTFTDKDFILGLASAQTTLAAVGRLTGAASRK